MTEEDSMTKQDLITALQPYSPDIEIKIAVDNEYNDTVRYSTPKIYESFDENGKRFLVIDENTNDNQRTGAGS